MQRLLSRSFSFLTLSAYVPQPRSALPRLDRSGNDLESFPLGINELRRLEELNLSANLIRSPPELRCFNLSKLRVLNLSRNKLSSCPYEVRFTPLLEELWLDRNSLTAIPLEILGLDKLGFLSLFGNPLADDFERFLVHNGASVLVMKKAAEERKARGGALSASVHGGGADLGGKLKEAVTRAGLAIEKSEKVRSKGGSAASARGILSALALCDGDENLERAVRSGMLDLTPYGGDEGTAIFPLRVKQVAKALDALGTLENMKVASRLDEHVAAASAVSPSPRVDLASIRRSSLVKCSILTTCLGMEMDISLVA